MMLKWVSFLPVWTVLETLTLTPQGFFIRAFGLSVRKEQEFCSSGQSLASVAGMALVSLKARIVGVTVQIFQPCLIISTGG